MDVRPRSLELRSVTNLASADQHTFPSLCVCVWVGVHVWLALASPALLNNEHSFKLGKLIKLKCLTGNHAKVKEMLCKLLLAPTFLGCVETLISRCVWFKLRSG